MRDSVWVSQIKKFCLDADVVRVTQKRDASVAKVQLLLLVGLCIFHFIGGSQEVV